MAEYIEREAAIDLVYDCCLESKSCNLNCVRDIPAADVVPVVRCEECKWSDNYGLDLMCKKHSGVTKNRFGEDIHFVECHSKNFFCSDGERMENDG